MKHRHLVAMMALTAAVMAAFTSCFPEEEQPVKPAQGIKSSDWQTVPSSGGTITLNDISIEFPAGAFAKDGKVAITPVKKGAVANAEGRELSEFYQLAFPSDGVKKPFTIRINYDGDVKRVLVMEESPKRERYTGKTNLHTAILGGSKKDGAISTTIDEIDPAEGEQPFMTIGLVDGSNSAAPETKANTTFHYTVDWCVPIKDQAKYDKHREAILNVVRKEMSTVATVLYNAGIEFSTYPVPYVITLVDGGKWGQHNSDRYRKKNGTVELDINNFIKLVEKGEPYNTDLYGQLQQTLVHETFHWVHEVVYDPRAASKICITGANEWSMLSEAVATWLEKFTGNKKISENCISFAESLIFDFFCSNGTDFEGTGYGMGLFIQWLSNKTSNKSIVKILEYQRDNGGLLYSASLRKAFDSFLADNKLQFFNPWDNWSKFIWDVIDCKEDSRLDSKGYGMTYRKKVSTASYKLNDSPVYSYGRTIQQIVPEGTAKAKLKTNPGLCMVYKQNSDKLRTWVCDASFNRRGAVELKKPYVLTNKDALSSNYHYIITERIKQDEKPAVMNNDATIEVIPWPKFVSINVEKGFYWDYYDWSDDEIKVSLTPNGYFVEADYPAGAHLQFSIGWVNDRFTDIANIYLHVDYDNSKVLKAGRLKLDYKDVSSIEKDLRWKGTYEGKDIIITCKLL